MNKHELQTIRQEAQRFMKDSKVTLVPDAQATVKVELSFTNHKNEPIYLFITKTNKSKKFTLLRYLESIGLIPDGNTLTLIQPVLHTFGLIITQGAVMMEDTTLPLHQRIRNMTQAIISIDGIIRLWKATKDINAIKS